MSRRLSPGPYALLLTVSCRQAEPPPHEVATSASAAPAVVVPAVAAVPSAPPPAPRPAPEPKGDFLYSKVRHLWIRPRPAPSKSWIGYLSLGDRVRVRGGDAALARVGPGHNQDCRAWYAVEPKGFVCAGERATLDGDDPTVRELFRARADASSPWPYRYGESMHAPVYRRPPSAAQQRSRELGLAAHLDVVARARAGEPDARRKLQGVDLSPAAASPPVLLKLPPAGMVLENRIHRGSTLAFVDRFAHEGRTFLMTWDRGFVPADKVRIFSEVAFEGVELPRGLERPLAWFRKEPRSRYRRDGDAFVATEESWPRLGHTFLTGREERDPTGMRFLETTESSWVAADDATVVTAAASLPYPVQADPNRTWLDVSILKGTLVAYEGDTPVFATLISPGRGGPPVAGRPPLDTASTPTGTFNVLGKFITATMVSGSISTLVHAEVQYTQNIGGPYALHGAYWHDRFGEPKSGGCINLAPKDAQRIFEWTRPRLPAGWHAMRTIARVDGAPLWEKPTVVFVRR